MWQRLWWRHLIAVLLVTQHMLIESHLLPPILFNVGGVWCKCLGWVFKMGNSFREAWLPLQQGRQEQEEYRESPKKRSLLNECLCYWPNFSIGLTSEYSKCYLLGRLHLTESSTSWWGHQVKHWNQTKTTSNGDTNDFCVHKCFSLGLPWLWIHHH